jgi:hypothetical protein
MPARIYSGTSLGHRKRRTRARLRRPAARRRLERWARMGRPWERGARRCLYGVRDLFATSAKQQEPYNSIAQLLRKKLTIMNLPSRAPLSGPIRSSRPPYTPFLVLETPGLVVNLSDDRGWILETNYASEPAFLGYVYGVETGCRLIGFERLARGARCRRLFSICSISSSWLRR